jgi:nitrite reductase/ring-hydroxylating ferredoxin subunit
MLGKRYTWIKIAKSESELVLNRESIGTLEVNGQKLCISKFDNRWFAFASICPHAGAPLSEGYVDEEANVVCPVHSYRFSIKNGRNAEGEEYRLRTHPVECRPEGVFIGFEEKRKWKWPGLGQ